MKKTFAKGSGVESVDEIDGMVNLLGIESPGLTTSLAIGHYVRDMLNAQATFG